MCQLIANYESLFLALGEDFVHSLLKILFGFSQLALGSGG